jgi:hypothetical protein
MPARRRPNAFDQTSILPFLRPKPHNVQDGVVVNVADSDDDTAESDVASPATPFTRRRFIQDEDDDVLLAVAPSQPLQCAIPAVVAVPMLAIQQSPSQIHGAAAKSRHDVIASPSDKPCSGSDLDACQRYEDEVLFRCVHQLCCLHCKL